MHQNQNQITMNKLLFLMLAAIVFVACKTEVKKESDPLPSWNNSDMKAKIISFVENEVPKIPVEDRIAVFDMDGTIACEEPLWLEMYSAVDGLNKQIEKDSSLLSKTIYNFASRLNANPSDTSVTNHYGPYIDSMIYQAYAGMSNEDYVAACNKLANSKMQPDYGMKLIETFYPPMKELLKYLQDNDFKVYIVSGSLQGLIWGVCLQAIGFDRDHLIGTRQQMSPVYEPGKQTNFILLPAYWSPKNNDDGKAIDIYTQLGKTPVFAFGNTTGDFGMFRLTSTNTLPNISLLLNHDDAEREYAYDPWHGAPMPAWRDTMATYGWNIVNMKENFKVVFEK